MWTEPAPAWKRGDTSQRVFFAREAGAALTTHQPQEAKTTLMINLHAYEQPAGTTAPTATIGTAGATSEGGKEAQTEDPARNDPAAAVAALAKFPLGHIVATPGALAAIPEEEILAALARHHAGDWGEELCPEDRQENERSLENGSRLLSAYRSTSGTRFWIITEADRSATTVLLPSEY